MRRKFMGLAGALILATAPISGQALAQMIETAGATVPFVIQQPANEWLASGFIRQAVHNTTGEIVGDINDLVFDRGGRISTVVIGVGGFLGMGEKSVGVAFSSLTFKTGVKGERVIVVALSKEALVNAPAFVSTEKTAFEKAKAKAGELGQQTADKAVELKDSAVRKYEDMRKPDPVKE